MRISGDRRARKLKDSRPWWRAAPSLPASMTRVPGDRRKFGLPLTRRRAHPVWPGVLQAIEAVNLAENGVCGASISIGVISEGT